MPNVILVEDDDNFRQRFVTAMERSQSMRLLATPGTVAEALACLQTAAPDILLVDLSLPDGSGLDVIRAASAAHPSCEILVVSVFGDQKNVLASIEAGATGYLLKDDPDEDYVARIEEMQSGCSPISPMLARQLLRKFEPFHAAPKPADRMVENITERELQVLNLLARGFNYQEIADILNVSRHTIGTYIKRVYGKLQVNSRSEAVFEARKLGFLQ